MGCVALRESTDSLNHRSSEARAQREPVGGFAPMKSRGGVMSKEEGQINSIPSGLARERFRENSSGTRKPTLLRVRALLQGSPYVPAPNENEGASAHDTEAKPWVLGASDSTKSEEKTKP